MGKWISSSWKTFALSTVKLKKNLQRRRVISRSRRASLKRPENFTGPKTVPLSFRRYFLVFLRAHENFGPEKIRHFPRKNSRKQPKKFGRKSGVFSGVLKNTFRDQRNSPEKSPKEKFSGLLRNARLGTIRRWL